MKNLIKRVFFTICSFLPISGVAYSADHQLEMLDSFGKEQFNSGADVSHLMIGKLNPTLKYKFTYEDAFKNLKDSYPGLGDDEIVDKFDTMMNEMIQKGVVIDNFDRGEILFAGVHLSGVPE